MTVTIKQRPIPTDVSALEGVHPILKSLYASRGIRDKRELDLSLKNLASYSTFLNMDKAIDLLMEALSKQQKILIIADFDTDGATSCALTIRCLKAFGFEHVDFIVPNRFEYGYGLTPEIVQLASLKKPDLIITVDNGITSCDGVDKAHELGIKVLITDHHLPAEVLPKAAAIVNPQLPGDKFPSKAIAGVGVVFYVMIALRARLKENDWFEKFNIPYPNLGQFLDLVALGTVADVAQFDQNNRILIQNGLQVIRTKAQVGIQALLQVAKRLEERVTASDLGFALGPRINAAGRLDDMSIGIKLLLEEDMEKALQLAQELDSLNKLRKEIEQDMKEEALSQLDKIELNEQSLPLGLCIYNDSFHQGVVGILASRLKERYTRPTIVFAKGEENTLKGSARSIKGVHIKDVLTEIDTMHPNLIIKHGGHTMAAGLSIKAQDIEAFTKAFNAVLVPIITQDMLENTVLTDGAMPSDMQNIETARLIKYATPWGVGFEEPVFEGVFEVVSHRVLADKHIKMMLKQEGHANAVDAIYFNAEPALLEDFPKAVCIVYKLDINVYQGNETLQLMCDIIKPL